MKSMPGCPSDPGGRDEGMRRMRRTVVRGGLACIGLLALTGLPLMEEEAMALTEKARESLRRMTEKGDAALLETDPEFAGVFRDFALGEVPAQAGLDDATRFTAILAVLLGCQGVDEFRAILPEALRAGLGPVEVKEIVYQSVAYLGMGRVRPFLSAVNEVLREAGVSLPLPPQGTVTRENRRERGTQAQVEIFGEGMREFWNSGPEETRHINRWLAANCFGDWYTRTGLDLKRRELITFCFLAAQGGCEPQLTAHAKGNFNMGNDRAFLVRVVSQCLPWLGYPRSLNALRCIREAAGEKA